MIRYCDAFLDYGSPLILLLLITVFLNLRLFRSSRSYRLRYPVLENGSFFHLSYFDDLTQTHVFTIAMLLFSFLVLFHIVMETCLAIFSLEFA